MQALHHLDPPGPVQAQLRPGGPAPVPAPCDPLPSPLARPFVEGERLRVGSPVDEGGEEVQALGAPVTDGEQMDQFDRPALLDDRAGRPTHGLDPGRELLGVGDGRRQADEPYVLWRVEDHLLPDRPPVAVLQVVHFVEDHEVEAGEADGIGVDHVSKDFGGHHDDGGVRVDRVVPGQQPDSLAAEPFAEVAELLVGESLQGGRVERTVSCRQREVDRVFGDDRLARAGGRRHEHRSPLVDQVECPLLERVERVVATCQQVTACGAAHALSDHFFSALPMMIEAS